MQTTDVRQTAQQAVDQSKSFLGKQVDGKTTEIGQQIGSVAQELRSVGDQLKQSPIAGPVAGYVDQGVEYVERLGRYLQDADSDRLIGDLESFARQQPWAVAAGALVVGFAASRFLKTSSTRRYRAGGYGSTSGTYGSGYGTSGYGISTGTAYGSTGTGYGTTDAGSGYGDTSYGDTGSGMADTTGIRSGGERYAT
ncbi:MAG: hypothetical protein QOI11_1626 [Candidatus Eremiobacteraeota bacterium]|jgi:hypothetical protein|nr:hypothetical protein [Candidatus Eremiobacteraeota bacterium]